MITVYIIMFAIDSSDFFIPATTSITRGHTLKPPTTTRLRFNFLSSRAVDLREGLPTQRFRVRDFKYLLFQTISGFHLYFINIFIFK